jgi:hypothetical protein
MRRFNAIVFAMTLGAAPVTQALGASCTQSDVQGAWFTYVMGSSVAGAYWHRCSLRFNASGRLQFASNCRDDVGNTSTVAGEVMVRPGCKILGEITQTFQDDSISRCSVDASIGPHKQVGNGVGECDDGSIFFFTMIDGT